MPMRNGKVTQPVPREEVRFGTVVADRFIVPDRNGKPAIKMQLDPNGCPSIELTHAGCEISLKVGHDTAGGDFMLFTMQASDGKAVEMSVGESESYRPELYLADGADGQRVTIDFAEDGPRLVFKDAAGVARLALGLGDVSDAQEFERGERPMMEMRDAAGKVVGNIGQGCRGNLEYELVSGAGDFALHSFTDAEIRRMAAAKWLADGEGKMDAEMARRLTRPLPESLRGEKPFREVAKEWRSEPQEQTGT